MGLFSDLDWLIILGVVAFLLFGQEGQATVRQLGRWYARALRLKQELVGQVARAADLPLPAGANPGSLRAALLGLDSVPAARVGIPAPVRSPPVSPPLPQPPSPFPTTAGSPVMSWSATFFAPGQDGRELR